MDWLYRRMFVILLSFCFTRAHKCQHDEYVASHNITATVSPQIYLNHPFEMTQRRLLQRKKKHGGREPQEHEGPAPRRGNWEPLRIHVDSSDIEKHVWLKFGNQATLEKIQTTILPLAINFLSKHLHVIPVNGNLKVTPEWCFETAVPDSHHTVGIPSADFVVYLTANEDNNDGNTLATGATCMRDQHDRPTAAQVELNLEAWEFSLYAQNYMVAVLVHELSHALGWSAQSFDKFRDENGDVRVNAVTSKTALGKTISLLSTPAVTSHVRSLFGCKTLTGMEIEDQGGGGTAGSHPETRIFSESYMAGITTATDTSFIIDAMALSVFQDSGWYQVENLDQAGKLSFGRGMGCRVPTHKCNDWGAEADARGLFCANQSQKFCTGNNKQVRGHCDIVQYSSAVPSMFRYFSSPTAGGFLQWADFCPRAAQYSNGDCTNAKNTLWADASRGTSIGTDARCFQSSLLSHYYQYDGRTADPECFRRTCKANQLDIHVNGKTVHCPLSNKATTMTVDGFYGHIVCPPYSGLSDIRCTPLCSAEDSECLGIKGSAADLKGSAAQPTGDTVVVHGRHLRH